MKKLAAFLWVIGLSAGCLWVLSVNTGRAESAPPPAPVGAEQQAQEAPQAPVLVTIPKLGIAARIVGVGTDSEGRMAVPAQAEDVGWWQPGTVPGETGSAVLAGHLDTPDGKPGVFAQLETLTPGDKIEIKDEAGRSRIFAVKKIEEYDDAAFPLEKVFAQGDGRELNLITCAGTWDRQAKRYTRRTVVFAAMEP